MKGGSDDGSSNRIDRNFEYTCFNVYNYKLQAPEKVIFKFSLSR